mmetsp:Transcript_58618/g.96766  ORF Transcript_58618/g.96766 Transcript_58618/m.96766 type:complete len:993 (-) Transcript_58618:255-3233(-)
MSDDEHVIVSGVSRVSIHPDDEKPIEKPIPLTALSSVSNNGGQTLCSNPLNTGFLTRSPAEEDLIRRTSLQTLIENQEAVVTIKHTLNKPERRPLSSVPNAWGKGYSSGLNTAHPKAFAHGSRWLEHFERIPRSLRVFLCTLSSNQILPAECNAGGLPRGREGFTWPWILATFLFTAWLIALGVMLWASPSRPDALVDRALVAVSLVTSFAALECATLFTHAASTLNVLLMHMAFVLYAVSCFTGDIVFSALDGVCMVLLYIALLLIHILATLARRSRAHLVALSAEVRELQLQQASLSAMLSSKADDALDEDSSDLEGDEREHLIVPPNPVCIPGEIEGRPEATLPLALSGRQFDHMLALRISSSMRKRRYTLAQFYGDVRDAFPELDLYLATLEGSGDEYDCVPPDVGDQRTSSISAPSGIATEGEPRRASQLDGKPGETFTSAVSRRKSVHGVTSGITSDGEYRRTIGAMFAFYWIMRIGLDGERGFSFGVDENWHPLDPPISTTGAPAAADLGLYGNNLAELEKRVSFYQNQDWSLLQQLLVDGGMLLRSADGSVSVVPERVLAMLALTAFHDVMKVEVLLPRVAESHAPYLGFKAGDVINDHDLALGYVLTHHADLLPSFAALSAASQNSIRFTQSKMSFNHGWLVQGEAPPSQQFARFKEVMMNEGVEPRDVAFYFTHWLTDLSGAEPSPLGGAEKLVLKFPHAVLNSFIRSFSVLNELAVKSETHVMEDYLVRTWCEQQPLMAFPGKDAIALMRLSLQAQTPERQAALFQAWGELSHIDRSTLSNEMARTGIEGQVFEHGPAFKQVEGPSFLVYYSPALIRNLVPAAALEALRVLAEIYRRARDLWPLEPSIGNGHSVTVRVDKIKELKLSAIVQVFKQGESWMLCRKNNNEAVVELHSVADMMEFGAQGIPTKPLKFWQVQRPDTHSQGQPSDSQSPASRVGSRGSWHMPDLPAVRKKNTRSQSIRLPLNRRPTIRRASAPPKG